MIERHFDSACPNLGCFGQTRVEVLIYHLKPKHPKVLSGFMVICRFNQKQKKQCYVFILMKTVLCIYTYGNSEIGLQDDPGGYCDPCPEKAKA